MRKIALLVASVLSVMLLTREAGADDKADAIRAAGLFEEGRRLLAAEDYAAACPKFAQSQALDPRPDTALDLGICYQRVSQLAFKASHDLAPPVDQSGGVLAPPSPAAPLAPGVEASSNGRNQRVVGLALAGTGVTAIVASLITGLVAKSNYDGATAYEGANGAISPAGLSQLHEAHNLATAATVLFVGGALGVGAGAIVFFSAPKSRTGASATVGLAPSAAGASLLVAGRF
jgi:hypothetical protein